MHCSLSRSTPHLPATPHHICSIPQMLLLWPASHSVWSNPHAFPRAHPLCAHTAPGCHTYTGRVREEKVTSGRAPSLYCSCLHVWQRPVWAPCPVRVLARPSSVRKTKKRKAPCVLPPISLVVYLNFLWPRPLNRCAPPCHLQGGSLSGSPGSSSGRHWRL